MKRIVLISIIIFILFITFFSDLFIPKRLFVAISNFIHHSLGVDLYQENVFLKLQNENLKAQLQRVNDSGERVPFVPSHELFIEARIFSSYPFNVKDTVTINRGSDDGIAVGMVAVVSDHILFGRVTSVAARFAVVQTIFDPRVQVPVKIGPDAINGLFEGGNDPRVVLVERPIERGDEVSSAAKEFPIGITIGEIKDVRQDSGGIFKEATLRVPYSVGDIATVYLLRP